MAVYSLSSKAAADLDEIYEYTILHLELEQARVYLLGLHERVHLKPGATEPHHRLLGECSPVAIEPVTC